MFSQDFISLSDFYFFLIFFTFLCFLSILAGTMDSTPRHQLFKNLSRLRKMYTKYPQRHHDLTMGLRSILETHISHSATDAGLRPFFLSSKNPIEFCDLILNHLSSDLEKPFSFPSSKTTKKSVSSRKKKSGFRHPLLASLFAQSRRHVVLDYKVENDFPLTNDVAQHYQRILQSVFSKKESFSSLTEFIECVAMEEGDEPLLIPLATRIRECVQSDLVSFLPLETLLMFFKEWNGHDSVLSVWHRRVRFLPLEDALKHQDTRLLGQMMDHLAQVYRCGRFQKFSPVHIETFSQHVQRYHNTSMMSIVTSIDIQRSLKYTCTKHTTDTEFPPWFLLVLDWLPHAKSFSITPKPESARRFMQEYFHPTTFQKKKSFMCRGVSYKIVYKMSNGKSLVQDESLFRQQHTFFREGRMSFSTFQSKGGQVYIDLCRQWMSVALHDVCPDAVETIIESIIQSCTCVRDFQHKMYHILGRLHPSFALSKLHVVMKGRLRVGVHVLDRLHDAPESLLFPEYDSFASWEQSYIQSEWEASRQEFFSIMWRKMLPPKRRCSLSPPQLPLVPTDDIQHEHSMFFNIHRLNITRHEMVVNYLENDDSDHDDVDDDSDHESSGSDTESE